MFFSLAQKAGDFDNSAVCRNKKDFSSVAFNVLFPCDDIDDQRSK
jgi:hypothetical protein